MLKRHQPLFEAVKIGNCEIKNRYAMSPMGTFGMTESDGAMGEACIEYYVQRARGGAGLIITGMCIVEDRFEKNAPSGVPLFSAAVDHERLKIRMKRLTDRVHAYGCKIFLQLSAGFGRVSHIGLFCGGAVAPSEVPNRFRPEIMHRALTTGEIHTYVESFAREAAFAKSVGFDGIEVHALHEGYLLDQFATDLFNNRQDEYGGSFENKYRFAVEVLQAVKGSCGKAFPVMLRYSPKHCMKAVGLGGLPGEEYAEAGRDLPEGLRAAVYLEKAGYDAFDVDLGCYDAHFWSHPPVYFDDGMYLDAAAGVKRQVRVPVLVSGRMDDPDQGAEAIAAGKCDMTALGRPLLADPELPNKVRAGQAGRVRACISCNYGCSVRIRTAGTIGCAVNAECANEWRGPVLPASVKKNVLVVGGGPAGMEFARVSRLRGHDVLLLEREAALGGQLIPAGRAPFKHHDRRLAAWFAQELKALGVVVRLRTAATPEMISEYQPDCAAVAVGASPAALEIPGADLPYVYPVASALMNVEEIGNRVVIIGAGQTGVELGIWLCRLGKQVTILSRSGNFMKGAYHNAAVMARRILEQCGAELIFNAVVTEIRADGVRMSRGEEWRDLPADTVVNAAGFVPNRALYDAVKNRVPEVYLLGDAAEPQNVYHAVHAAYETAGRL